MNNQMKVTRKQYERAKAVVEDAREQLKLVRFWDEATRDFGPRESHEIVAVEQRADGSIDIKCRLICKPTEAAAGANKP